MNAVLWIVAIAVIAMIIAWFAVAVADELDLTDDWWDPTERNAKRLLREANKS